MDWNGVIAFTRTVQSGTVQQSAHHLGITVEEVQQRIARLEKSLGVSLITEHQHQLILTPLGQLAFVQFQALLEASSQVEQSLIQQQSSLSGPLNLTLPHLFGIHQLLPILPEFMRYYPEIELNLRFVKYKNPTPRHPSELAISNEPGDPAAQIARKLITNRYVLVASPKYLHTDNLPQRARDLKNHQLLGLNTNSESEVNIWYLHNDHEKVQVRPHNLQVNDEEALLEAALNGLGIALVEERAIERHIKRGQLVQLLGDYQTPIESYYLISQRSLRQPARYQAFVDFMLVNFCQPELTGYSDLLRSPSVE